jgi:hypothetical protein
MIELLKVLSVKLIYTLILLFVYKLAANSYMIAPELLMT